MARILVIDDCADVRDYVRDVLSASGHDVAVAEDLEEARASLLREAFDAVVADIELPDGDGLSLLPFIGASRPATRVIVMTGHTSYDHAVRALHGGAYDFIPKPIDRHDLCSAVSRAVEARALEAQNHDLLQKLADRVRTVNEVLSIGREISSNRDLEDVLFRALDRAVDFLGAEDGAILLTQPDGTLRVAVVYGGADPARALLLPLPAGRGIAGWVLEHKRPLVVNDTRKDPRFDELLDGVLGGYVRNALACPLLVKDKPVGVLQVMNRRWGRFTREARLAAEALSYSVAAAVANAQITDTLARTQKALVEHNALLETRVLERTGELRAANERLAAANRRLEETRDQMIRAEKMASIGCIAAGVAHEINNPIGFINSNLQTLKGYLSDLRPVVDELRRRCPPSDGLEERMRKIDFDFVLGDMETLAHESEDGVRRVVKIVKDLKTYSRADKGVPEEADLAECVESALSLSRNETKYVADIETDLARLPRLRCFPTQITQVLVNLVVNAAHAIEKHGTITVRSRLEADYAVVEVADTGCGIPPENLTRIFDPFFTTKDPGRGTGLGLSLSYEIVERHQGEISVASTVGIGTTFTLRLPISGVAAVAA